LIDACHILTAAHCIKKSYEIDDYQIVLGEFQVDQEDEEKIVLNASFIKIHPGFEKAVIYK